LASQGYAGATIAAVALEAGIAPGLIHHHFDSKEELLGALLQQLLRRFRERVAGRDDGDGDRLLTWVDAALKLDERADVTAARCWVGLFAEAVRNPALFRQTRRVLDTQIADIGERSEGALDARDSSAVLAFVVGSLVLGAFAPQKTAGFAAPALRRLVGALRARS
jgi:TetR/AcrR family transcriptional repressor of bet genes